MSAPCPHVVSSDEGTMYCALAEDVAAERDRLRATLEAISAQRCECPAGRTHAIAASALKGDDL